jgi:putative sterol carrier protein
MAVVSGPNVLVGDGQRAPTLEDVHRNWAQIDSLAGSQEYENATAALMAMMAPPSSLQPSAPEGPEESEDAPITVQAIFERMPEYFQADAAAGVDVVFQFTISGPGGGDWYVAIKDGTCTVEAGVHGSPTTTLKIKDEDFLQLIGGQLPAMQAFTTGKLKIEGDLMKSQLIEKLFRF